MATTHWEVRNVAVAGHRVVVRAGQPVAGTTPLVHVHGFGISGRSLLPTAAALADRVTTLVPDLPGHGQSPAWGAPLGIPGLARALLGTLDALGLDRVFLLGNSMGGPVSLEVAHLAADRVAGIILTSPAGGAHNQPLGRAVVQLARDAPKEAPRMIGIAVPDYLNYGPLAALRSFRELVHFPSLERLLHTPVPTLAVLGSRDPLMPPPRRAIEIARLAPAHLTVAVIEGAAHGMNFSHPGELAHAVSSWLDGVEITDDPESPGLTRVLQLTRPRTTPNG